MDTIDNRVVLKFIADILYIKRLISSEVLEDIYNAKDFSDLDKIIDNMLRGDYSAYKRGAEHLLGGGSSSN